MRGLCECPALTSVDLSHNGFDVCADESSLSPAGRGASTLGAGPPRGPNELDTLTADEKAVEPTGAKRLDDRRELDGKQDSQSTQTSTNRMRRRKKLGRCCCLLAFSGCQLSTRRRVPAGRLRTCRCVLIPACLVLWPLPADCRARMSVEPGGARPAGPAAN
eukprot:GHVT01026207.1.p3 GENE.GHVT01026207.1~~GHVT01026207.1.p3  ORF type:complete len:162 (+),score=34.41 GHVT01026207.1:1185-1670(+)